MANASSFLQNIYSKTQQFEIPVAFGDNLSILTEAWRKDPRYIALFNDIQSQLIDDSRTSPSLLGSAFTKMAGGRRWNYIVDYNGINVEDVKVIEFSKNQADFSIKQFIDFETQKNGFPPERVIFVTNDGNKLWSILQTKENIDYFDEKYELFNTIAFNSVGFGLKGCKYNAYELIVDCKIPPAAYYNYEKKAKDKEAQLVRALGINSPNIPNFMKVFIAFSYIQQEVDYDSVAATKLSNGEPLSERETLSLTAYGALCNHRATSRGLSDALEWLLDFAGVGCEKIDGRLNEIGAEPEYFWNIVWLDNDRETAFCDCGYGIENARVNQMVDSTAFLKDVNDFIDLKYDIWESSPNYIPRSVNTTIEDVIEYIRQNEQMLKSLGIPEKYLFTGILNT